MNIIQTQRVKTPIPVLPSAAKSEKTTPSPKKGTHAEAAASSHPSFNNGKHTGDHGDDIIVLKENLSKTETKSGFSHREQVQSKQNQSVMTARKPVRRPRLKLEVCIRTDESSRGRLALAGSFEEVIRSLSLQSSLSVPYSRSGTILNFSQAPSMQSELQACLGKDMLTTLTVRSMESVCISCIH